jgi:hypothetical protein
MIAVRVLFAKISHRQFQEADARNLDNKSDRIPILYALA